MRHWCSSRYLRISPLHREFHSPLPNSSAAVFGDPSQLSREISRRTCRTAYAPFTPSNSEQRWPPTYYRGCWHVVSRGFFCGYRHADQRAALAGWPALGQRPALVSLRPRRKSFTPRRASSLTRRRCIRVAPIVQDSPLLPPVGVWAVFQSQCGRASSQTGYRSQPWWAVTSPTS